MSYTLKNIYKKPADNPDLEINFWGSDILTLIDTFRVTNPKKRLYTYSHTNGISSARLDRVYLSN